MRDLSAGEPYVSEKGELLNHEDIFNIFGYNADAIDIGEEATNIIIDSVLIFNAFDK